MEPREINDASKAYGFKINNTSEAWGLKINVRHEVGAID